MRAFWFIFCEPEKLTTKLHENSKNYILGLFCALFPHVKANEKFFLENLLLSFFLFPDFCCCAELLKKANQRKVGYRHLDQQKDAQTQTDRHELKGPSPSGVQKETITSEVIKFLKHIFQADLFICL